MGKREQKRQKMSELMERWSASGLSARAFAKESKVPEARLWYWKRRATRKMRPPAFVPVQILADERPVAAPCFELTFGDGRRLLIPPALTGPALRRLLSALRSC